MPGLRNIQEHFSASIFDCAAEAIFDNVAPGAFEPRQRLQIYRNNVVTGFTDALRAVYPVIEALVGEGFFLYAASEFINRHPSTSGDLHDFGREFGMFLAAFEPAGNLPYLPDVARLEWNYHEAYHEADADALDIHALGQVPPDRYEQLRFRLHPACRLMRSEFPIIEIWHVNQEDYEGDQTIDLGSGGVRLLMSRQGDEIALHPVDRRDYEMLTMIARGETLGDCLDIVQGLSPDFDLSGFLSCYVGNRTLVEFTVS